MVVNQHCIWNPEFGNKYPLKLKILTPLLVLKRNQKMETCQLTLYNFQSLHTQFRFYLKSIQKYLLVKTRII